MAKALIESGVCGFKTTIEATTDDSYQTSLVIQSNCPHVIKLAENLEQLNAMNELFKKGQSKVLAQGSNTLPHITCPVPVGILKAIEVSAGMALPKDVTVKIEK